MRSSAAGGSDGPFPARASSRPIARPAELRPPTHEGLEDLGEPCELCGYGTRPTGPLEWELVECQWCYARVRVHIQCDERVQEAFPQVDCPRCGHVWPDWWQLSAEARDDR